MKCKTVIYFLILISYQAKSQDGTLLMAENYSDLGQSSGGKYMGFHNTNSAPYHIDAEGRISGRHITFHENGAIETLGNYRVGVKHGLWMSYDFQGNVLSQAYYTDGRKDGAWKVWDSNGTLRCEMFYQNGLRIKTWNFYDQNGVLASTRSY